MGLTLLEAAKAERDPQRGAIIRILNEGELLPIMNIRDVDGAGLFYDQEGELPGVGFRGINEGLDHTYGVLNPQAEALKIIGADIDVDKFLLDTQGDAARANQIEMKIRSLRLTIEDRFINGDESLNPRESDGLRKRITTGSSQSINANGALSLAALDELCDAVDAQGGRKYLVMSKAMRRRLTQAHRNPSIGNFLESNRDEFGRLVTMYNDIPIVVTDVNAQNQLIQPFNEEGSADRTSIYCVSFGDTLTTMLQGRINGQPGISSRMLGEVDDAPVDRTRVEWYVAFGVLNGRSCARLRNITNAPVVA